MKLNPDCVRDVLLSVEDNTGYNIILCYPDKKDKCPLLDKYSTEEVMYHFYQCAKSNFVELIENCLDSSITISDLTPSGHEFLANIRSDTVWSNVKEISKTVDSKSLNALSQIATSVITTIIKSQLGLT